MTRRDYVLVTPDLLPAVCGYQARDVGLSTHDAVRLTLDVARLKGAEAFEAVAQGSLFDLMPVGADKKERGRQVHAGLDDVLERENEIAATSRMVLEKQVNEAHSGGCHDATA